MDGHLPMEFVVKLEDAGVDMPTYHSLSFLDLSSPGFRKKVPANLDAFFLKLERRANEVREALRDYWVDEAAIKVTATGTARRCAVMSGVWWAGGQSTTARAPTPLDLH